MQRTIESQYRCKLFRHPLSPLPRIVANSCISEHSATHLRSAFLTECPESLQGEIDGAVNQICADNLEMACARIEKAATEKALSDVDSCFPKSSQNRQQYIVNRYLKRRETF
jgi:hypothetical protein